MLPATSRAANSRQTRPMGRDGRSLRDSEWYLVVHICRRRLPRILAGYAAGDSKRRRVAPADALVRVLITADFQLNERKVSGVRAHHAIIMPEQYADCA